MIRSVMEAQDEDFSVWNDFFCFEQQVTVFLSHLICRVYGYVVGSNSKDELIHFRPRNNVRKTFGQVFDERASHDVLLSFALSG